MVVATNGILDDSPEIINSDPYGAGWFAIIEGDISPLDALMDAAAYSDFSE
jgi:glycine cleavage system H protein